MKTLIAYATKYGATTECAKRIKACLGGEVDLRSLEDSLDVDLAPYERVIIGSSIYMGKPRKAARKFCQRNIDVLEKKQLGLFLCCIQDIEKNVLQQFDVTFPKPLLDHAVAKEQMGAIVDFTKLSAFDKVIMNMVAGDLRKKMGGDVITTLSDDRIRMFCRMLKKAPVSSTVEGE